MQEPMKLQIVNVMVGAEEDGEGEGLKGRAVVELKGVDGLLKNGMWVLICRDAVCLGKEMLIWKL